MRKALYAILLCMTVLLAACAKGDVSSNQSIQNLIAKNTDFKKTNASDNKTTTKSTTKMNDTVLKEPDEITDQIPVTNKKCRYSTILYDGCKWKDAAKTNFDLRIINAGKKTIPGVWFIIRGESGEVKYVKRTKDVLAGGTRTYNVLYNPLVEEMGMVKKFEVLPVEEINGTEYACENMRVYTIPEAYCKPSEPVHITGYGTVNATRVDYN